MKLSVIIPCKNEENTVDKLYEDINKTLKGVKYEAIFVNDGSTDSTMDKLRELYEKDVRHVKVISFSKNFRKEAAILAGLRYATGDYTAIIDGNLEQNPEYLKEMIEVLDKEKEYDEVAMIPKERVNDSPAKARFRKRFYRMMNKLCNIDLENADTDYRLFRKNVKDAILSLSEKNRFSRGMFSWIGFNIKFLTYEQEKNNRDGFNFKESFRYAVDGISAFTNKPLRWASKLGCFTIIADLIYLLVMIILCCTGTVCWSFGHTILMFMFLLFGVLFIILGIIGNYLALITTEVKNRPNYLIKEKLGFDETIL